MELLCPRLSCHHRWKVIDINILFSSTASQSLRVFVMSAARPRLECASPMYPGSWNCHGVTTKRTNSCNATIIVRIERLRFCWTCIRLLRIDQQAKLWAECLYMADHSLSRREYNVYIIVANDLNRVTLCPAAYRRNKWSWHNFRSNSFFHSQNTAKRRYILFTFACCTRPPNLCSPDLFINFTEFG